MDKPELTNTVFVFDLDDTLYPEIDYVRSGMAHVCNRLLETLGVDLHQALTHAVSAGERDWLAWLAQKASLPASAVVSLLWIYRLHSPTLTLAPDCASLLDYLQRAGAPVLVLTDGRSITQRLKLKSLGLSHLPALISEDWGDQDKRSPTRFLEVMARFPDKAWLYVGDNPAKDFIMPRALGWRTVGVKAAERGIHQAQLLSESLQHQPEVWLSRAGALREWLETP